MKFTPLSNKVEARKWPSHNEKFIFPVDSNRKYTKLFFQRMTCFTLVFHFQNPKWELSCLQKVFLYSVSQQRTKFIIALQIVKHKMSSCTLVFNKSLFLYLIIFIIYFYIYYSREHLKTIFWCLIVLQLRNNIYYY